MKTRFDKIQMADVILAMKFKKTIRELSGFMDAMGFEWALVTIDDKDNGEMLISSIYDDDLTKPLTDEEKRDYLVRFGKIITDSIGEEKKTNNDKSKKTEDK